MIPRGSVAALNFRIASNVANVDDRVEDDRLSNRPMTKSSFGLATQDLEIVNTGDTGVGVNGDERQPLPPREFVICLVTRVPSCMRHGTASGFPIGR